MYTRFSTNLLLAVLFMISAVQTHQLSSKDEIALANMMERREEARSRNLYVNLVRGILRSDKVIQNIAEIPCSVIETLETDVDAAQQFVEQIAQGQVPTIIKDLPQTIVHEFVGVVQVALALPTEIRDAAEAAVTGAVRIANDIESGAITHDIQNLPADALSAFSAAWGDFTDGLGDAVDALTHLVGCEFKDCTSSAPACVADATVTATTTPAVAATSVPLTSVPLTSVPLTSVPLTSVPLTPALLTPTQYFNTSVTSRSLSAGPVAATESASSSSGAMPSRLGPKAASSLFESNGVKIWALFFLAVLGVAVLL